MLLHAFVAAASAAAPPAVCPAGFVVQEGYGMTHGGHYYVSSDVDAAGCCALCAKATRCNAWTYHAGQSLCESAPVATMVMGKDKISGSKVAPQPGPHPPGPPLPPAPRPPIPPPKPPLGRQPNLVLVLQDDMDICE